MTDDDTPLPLISGGRISFEKPRPRAQVRMVRSNGSGGGGILATHGTFTAAFAVSLMAGVIAGVGFGGFNGVKKGLEAGAKVDTALLGAPASGGASSTVAVEPVLDEIRSLHAQLEQLRHGAETQRTTERLKALEHTIDANQAAAETLDHAASSLASKLEEIEQRLARVEQAGIDTTPVGSIRQSEKGKREGRRGRPHAPQ